jgi:hypothetical protein
MPLPKKALVLTGLITLGALAAVSYAVSTMRPMQDYRWLVLFTLALVTARLKVKLPGLTGNMSVNLPFLLIAVSQLSLLEALLVALPACVVQCWPKGGGKPKLVQMLFNLSMMAVAVTLASLISMTFATPLGAAVFFLAQTIPVAGIIRITEGGAIYRIWSSIAHCSFPFYVLSAGLTSIATSTTPQLGWQLPLVGLPVLFAIYRSYVSYFGMASLAQRSVVEAR